MPEPRYQISIDGEPLDPQVLANVTRVELRESESEPAFLALRANLVQQPDGSFSPIDDDAFRLGAKLSLLVIPPGGTKTYLFQGFITHLRPHFETIESNAFLEVLGMDAAVLMNAGERSLSYPDLTDAETAQAVFDAYGLTLDPAPTEHRHEERIQLLVQRGSDWKFVQRLAARNGFICYLDCDPQSGEVAPKFAPRAISAAPQADLTLLREGSNLKWLDLQLCATGPAGAEGAAINPFTKQVLQAAVSEPERLEGAQGVDALIEAALSGAGAPSTAALVRDGGHSQSWLDAQAGAAAQSARFAIEARGEVDPALYRGLLRARRPAMIKGVGRAFAGSYWVRAVRTVIDEGVISQTFVAERDAFGLAGGETFGASAEEVGPQ